MPNFRRYTVVLFRNPATDCWYVLHSHQDLLAMPKVVENLSSTDHSGNTPLHIAAECNYVGAVSLLLTKGTDCNPKNKMGRTPLHLAAARGSDA